MKKLTRNIHIGILCAIGSIIPIMVIWIIYDLLKSWVFDFDFSDTLQIIWHITITTIAYYGVLNLLKPFLESFGLLIKNKSIMKFLTILITALSTLVLFGTWEEDDILLNYNDRGIVLEMIGFFIYLNPVSKYLTNFITTENEVDHRLMIRTTAIVLVLSGLILQFSYFT